MIAMGKNISYDHLNQDKQFDIFLVSFFQMLSKMEGRIICFQILFETVYTEFIVQYDLYYRQT